MQDVLKQREQLSALADGALEGAELAEALNGAARSEDALATWEVYHLVGDVLRSSELAQPGDSDLLARLRVQIAQEPRRPAVPEAPPLVVAPIPAVQRRDAPEAANAALWRWRMVAGVASVAALVMGSWTVMGGLGSAEPTLGGGAVMASGSAAPSATPVATADVRVAGQGAAPLMLRDPRLDELVAAQRQHGNPTATLQMPADFLRNATFEQPASR